MLLDPSALLKIRQNLQNSQDLLKSTPESLQKEKFLRKFQASASQINNLQLNIETEGYQIIFDQPSRNGGNEKGPCPVSMLIGAFAACLEMDWLVLISLSDLDVEYLKVSITGELDGRYNLGKKSSPPPRLTQIKIQTIIQTTEDHSIFDHLLQKAIKMCPVGGSLHPDIKKTYTLEFQ